MGNRINCHANFSQSHKQVTKTIETENSKQPIFQDCFIEQFDNPSRNILTKQFLNTSVQASKRKLEEKYFKLYQPQSTQMSDSKKKPRKKTASVENLVCISDDSNVCKQLSDYILETAKNIYQPMQINFETFVQLKYQSICFYYTVQQKIGQGGYGNVYRAKCLKTGQPRAIKILKKKSMANSKKKAFMSQMDILRKLDHPNIIKLYQLYYHKNFYYVVTQYCQGGALIDFVNKRFQNSEKLAKIIFKQLINTVCYLHRQKIVHRDLKLQNMVFLQSISKQSEDKNLNIKIIDFGSATIIKYSKNPLASLVGTISYMAPQIIDGYYNQKCDIWSCGVILSILLTGKSPFKCRSKQQTLENIKNKQITCKQPQWKNVSFQAKDLVKKLLNKNYNTRINAEAILKHSWLNSNQIQSNQILQNRKSGINVITNLSLYYFANNFISLIQSYLSFNKISQKQRQQLGQIFNQIDRNRSGNIDLDQLKAVYSTFSGHKQQYFDIEYIFNNIDKDKSGTIAFSQFLVAMYGRKKLFVEQSLLEAFNYLDVDQTGFIEKHQLKYALKKCNQKQIDMIIQKIDTNGDQKISKEQFITYLTSFDF